jgi:LPXTG-site transpeptidase (sortase) family protein
MLGYAGFQKAQVAYHQHKLRLAYQDTFFEVPESSVPYRRVVFREWQPMRLLIPKINVDLMVLSGDAWDMELHNKGPVHFQMSDLPSTESGNVAIAGHRGTRWGFFTDLDLLAEGDEIYLDIGGYRFIYRVSWVRIVDPDALWIIDSTPDPVLTLQTCEPKYAAATHRLIVRASFEKVEAAPEP